MNTELGIALAGHGPKSKNKTIRIKRGPGQFNMEIKTKKEDAELLGAAELYLTGTNEK